MEQGPPEKLTLLEYWSKKRKGDRKEGN